VYFAPRSLKKVAAATKCMLALGRIHPSQGSELCGARDQKCDWFPYCVHPVGQFFLFMYFALQGMAFTLEERQTMGIHGLFPPRFKTQEEQLELCKVSFDRYTEDLNKYLYLVGLQVNAKKYNHIFLFICNFYLVYEIKQKF
jgi:hypothetical protein